MTSSFLNKIFVAIKHPGSILHPNSWNNEVFISYLRSKGAIIGNNTRFISPSNCSIDPGRLDYISIGSNCCLSVVSIIAHDYSWYTLLTSKGDMLPDAGGRVTIGNNCFIGYQSLIMKGVSIGDNVIVGARSVVLSGTIIPSNTVWAGCPAKQICTIDDLYQKRTNSRITDAIYHRNHLREKLGREVTIQEMGFFAYLFIDRTEENYDTYFQSLNLNGVKDCEIVRDYFFNSKPIFSSFEDFLSI